MTDRIIEISETAAFLSCENHLLKIKFPDRPDKISIPVGDIQCLLLENPAVTITGALLAELSMAKCMVVICGKNHLPVSMQLPMEGHYTQNERFRAQIDAPKPLMKRLWQEIVKTKIKRQAALLAEVHGEDFGVKDLVKKVASGDSGNVESRAAVLYWKHLFRGDFKRDREATDANMLLNYGYSILRAMAARSCCSVGLHPTIGINHHNQYDAYCLADDVMEPFRPVVDRKVVEMNPCNAPIESLTRSQRAELLNALLDKIETIEGMWSVTDLLRISCEQLARSFQTGEVHLKYF